jgi:hypothetical protein
MLYSFHALLLGAWIISTLIDEFSTGIFHVSFWFVIELAVLFIGITAMGSRNHHIFVITMTSIGIASIVTHLIFSAVELIQCTSALCVGPTWWILIIFVIILSTIGILEGIEIYYVWRHRKMVAFYGTKK